MKKSFFISVILFLLLSINVSADLSDKQAKEVASFARNLINKGLSSEHVDSKGMPLLVYKQGPARVYGYQEKMSLIDKDFIGSININSNKWAFDCASFTSYVLKKTLGITLLDSNYLGGNPYMVNKYETDRTNFKSIGLADNNKDGMTGQDLYNLKSSLKEGDLIVVVGHHIGMYVGNNEVAESTPSYIGLYSNNNSLYKGDGLYNLGIGITNLDYFINQRMVKNNRFMILRIRDGVVEESLVPNTYLTWPDTGKVENLGSSIDDSFTNIETTLSTLDYANKVNVEINITNSNGIKEVSIGKSKNYENINNQTNYHKTIEVMENGTYYIYVKDLNDNETSKVIEITNIDNNAPIIEKIEFIDNAIVVTASDKETFYQDLEYSFDNQDFTKEPIYFVSDNKTYNIKVRDKAGNVSESNYALKKDNILSYLGYGFIGVLLIIIIIASYKINTKKKMSSF